ncbi:MAG: hypothetical protein KJ048_17535 [Dehalococcoidia bacterium]|nr:hypothetical protein [Dehalococcoidia bacterium]
MTLEETIQRVRQGMAALSQGGIDACGALIHPQYTNTVVDQHAFAESMA